MSGARTSSARLSPSTVVAIVRGIGGGLLAAGLVEAGLGMVSALLITFGLQILTGARR